MSRQASGRNSRNGRERTEKVIFDGVPPHDEAAEAAVLGAMLAEERAASLAIELLVHDDFHVERHALLFDLFAELHEKQPDLDTLFVKSELERRGLLERIGGAETLGKIIENTPTAANIERYCQIVRDRAIERELLTSAVKIAHRCRQPEGGEEASAILEEAEKLILDIADRRTSAEPVAIHDILEKVLLETREHMAAKAEGRELPSLALPTGFSELDRLFAGGLWPGEVIIVAARPSVGKTTFSTNIARKVACRPQEKRPMPTGIFSLEMPKEQVSRNMLCAEARLSSGKLRANALDEADFEDFQHALRNLQQAPIFIDDTPGLTPGELRARARRLHHRHGVKLLLIDYLQLMQAPGRDSREQEVAELSRQVKNVARELNIPIILLSQLRRPIQGHENQMPNLTDLRESGSIEQDADVVIMLHRKQDEETRVMTRETTAIVLKNRNGETGPVNLSYFPDQFRFENFVPEV